MSMYIALFSMAHYTKRESRQVFPHGDSEPFHFWLHQQNMKLLNSYLTLLSTEDLSTMAEFSNGFSFRDITVTSWSHWPCPGPEHPYLLGHGCVITIWTALSLSQHLPCGHAFNFKLAISWCINGIDTSWFSISEILCSYYDLITHII